MIIKNRIRRKSAKKKKAEKRYLEEVINANDLSFLLERKYDWSYTSSHPIKENLRRD